MPNYPGVLFGNKMPKAIDQGRRGNAADVIYLSVFEAAGIRCSGCWRKRGALKWH